MRPGGCQQTSVGFVRLAPAAAIDQTSQEVQGILRVPGAREDLGQSDCCVLGLVRRTSQFRDISGTCEFPIWYRSTWADRHTSSGWTAR